MKSATGTFINWQGTLVIPVVLGLTVIFNNRGREAIVHRALHGK
jgi:hypothetical protein